MTQEQDFRRPIRLLDKAEGFTEDEIAMMASELLLRLADMCDLTIRTAGERLLSSMEQSWENEGGDISLPPRAGSGLDG